MNSIRSFFDICLFMGIGALLTATALLSVYAVVRPVTYDRCQLAYVTSDGKQFFTCGGH